MDNAARYSKVAVLIVKWIEELDKYAEGHNQEIEQLITLLEGQFHFECSISRLDDQNEPQNQLNGAIANHIALHDGPNNLLIVYYTGHGCLLGEQLELSAVPYPTARYHPTAMWRMAEKPLIESAESDVLTILDCCFASNAIKSTSRDTRIYELLAACPLNERTYGPGEGSLTTILLKTMINLLGSYGRFSVLRLVEAVNKTRTQTTALRWDRLGSHDRSVILEPLSMKGGMTLMDKDDTQILDGLITQNMHKTPSEMCIGVPDDTEVKEEGIADYYWANGGNTDMKQTKSETCVAVSDDENQIWLRNAVNKPSNTPTGGFNVQPYYRFDNLQARIILELQNEIRSLENDLDKIDDSRRGNRMFMSGASGPTSSQEIERGKLISTIGEKLVNYYELLAKARTLDASQRPSTRSYWSLNSWFGKEKLLSFFLEGFERRKDLFTSQNGRGWAFPRGLLGTYAYSVSHWPPSCLNRLFNHFELLDQTFHYYTSRNNRRSTIYRNKIFRWIVKVLALSYLLFHMKVLLIFEPICNSPSTWLATSWNNAPPLKHRYLYLRWPTHLILDLHISGSSIVNHKSGTQREVLPSNPAHSTPLHKATQINTQKHVQKATQILLPPSYWESQPELVTTAIFPC
ncbi:hypothetical protein K505DRAFT_393051 [Melanomma pulvis-pyrius CBS 109.77]|uniref:DUF6594 domain-containing protein n=1 Tax=Melanomma pulvis-pyrius CBS 109.77 TaxID=1314802 RepID=A0A6A6WY83_9PLEO|nr:hypothetical protein K505DRAFT_393051 [Melanomma pulvis-pyrius CBS 109.77]